MILRLKALRSLRWNYRWGGVWVWLRGRRRCRRCAGVGTVPGESTTGVRYEIVCPRCHGKPKRGYQRILSEPEQVLAEQDQLASGAYV